MEIGKIGPRGIQAYQQQIGKVEDKPISADQIQRAGSEDSAKAAEKSSRTKADHVQLSTEAKELQRLKDIVAKAPDVREDKVQDLKQQIKAGTYRVSAEQVADKILGGRIDAKA